MKFLGLEFELTRRSDPVLSRDDLWMEVASLAASGSMVTPDRAVQHAAVYACVKVIAETIATLPLITYSRAKDGSKSRATELPIYDILNTNPNADLKMSRVDFLETQIAHLLLRGNAYAQIISNRVDVKKLVPIHPDKMIVKVEKSGKGQANKVVYKYKESGQEIEIPSDQILHIKDWCPDGVLGKSRIEQTKDTIGLALAKDSYESLLYAQGTRLSGLLTHPKTLTDETASRIGKSFRESYSGKDNMHKVAILEEGMDFKQISMTNSDAEFVESRKLSVVDICRIFRVPPHVIADLSNSTFSNIEHQSIAFVVHTIRPWIVRIEQAINRDIIPLVDRGKNQEIYAEFLIDGLLRGDQKSRYESYKIGLGNGFLSPNDIRALENMNPIEGGERYFIPANNMVPLDRMDEYVDAQVQDNSQVGVLDNPLANVGKSTQGEEQDGEVVDESEKNSIKFRDFAAELKVSYLPVVVDAFQRCLTKEINEVARFAKSKDATKKIVNFYSEKHPANIQQNLLPALRAVDEQLSVGKTIFAQKSAKRSEIAGVLDDFTQKYVNSRLKRAEESQEVKIFADEIASLDVDLALTEMASLVDSLIATNS